MKRAILTACILAVPLAGCTANAESFWKESIRLGCRFQKKCAKAAFNDNYDDLADCKDEASDTCSPEDFADACADYDSDEAKDCLSQTREQIRKCEVDDNDDDCDLVRICGDDPETQQALWTCFAGGSNDGDGIGDGYPPDGTGLSVPYMDELSQLPEDGEDPAEPDEDQ